VTRIEGIICTSLTPNNLPLQQKTVNSWRYAGFKVIPVSSADEIYNIKLTISGDYFIKADQDAH